MNLTTIMAAGKRSCGVIKMIKKDYNDFVNEMLEGVVFLSDEDIAKDTRAYKISISMAGKSRPHVSKVHKGKIISNEMKNHLRKMNKGKSPSNKGISKYKDEELNIIAKKYKSKVDFRKNDKLAWQASIRKGKTFYNTICKHMKRLTAEKWTKQTLIKFVKQKKFKTRTEFNKKASGAYSAAWKMKLLDELFPKKK